MATVEDVLNLARSQLGVCENPMGSNSGTPYHAWYGPESQGWQWCAIFVCWLFHHTDPALIHYLKSAYSGDFLTTGRLYGEEVTSAQAEPGDIVVFDYGDGGRTDHVAVVEKRLDPISFQTIEGNVGNCVGRKTRRQSGAGTCQMWFIHPKYAVAPPQEPRKKEEPMLYQGSGAQFTFEDCYADRYDYWLHTRGEAAEIRFTLISHDTGKAVTTDPQPLKGHKLHNLQSVAANPKYATKGSYTLVCTATSKIRWGLREVPK